MQPTIVILGRDTCEDTTRSRDHLNARGIAFEYRHVDLDPDADSWIRRLNDGVWVTPTILLGDPKAPAMILREPSDAELDEAIAAVAAAAEPGG